MRVLYPHVYPFTEVHLPHPRPEARSPESGFLLFLAEYLHGGECADALFPACRREHEIAPIRTVGSYLFEFSRI